MGVGAERLFAENVEAVRKGEAGLLAVELERGGEDHQVGARGGAKFFEGAEDAQVSIFKILEAFAGLWEGIDSGDKLEIGRLRVVQKSVYINMPVAA
jgi:hypothetical protein